MENRELKFKHLLNNYLPPNALDYCTSLWIQHPFHFKIKKRRSTKLGDYRFNPKNESHTITVNFDLNPYSFLVTYLHEVAHLITYKSFGRKVKPHGTEWKDNFKQLTLPMINNEIFPDDVLMALARYIKNPKASSCSDHNLYQALGQYDSHNKQFLSEVVKGDKFVFNTRVFQKEELRRTRYVCKEIISGKRYLISKSAQVELHS